MVLYTEVWMDFFHLVPWYLCAMWLVIGMDSEGDGRLSLKESIAKVYSTKPNRKYEGIVKRFLDIVHHNPNAYALPMLSDSITSMVSELHTKDTTIFQMGHDRFVLIYEIAFQVFYFHNQYDSNRMAELFSFYIEDFKAFYVFVAVDHFFNEEFNHIVSAAEAEGEYSRQY